MKSLTVISLLLVMGNFLLCTTSYMVIPFLSLYLKNNFQFNSSNIGLIIGITPLIACLFSFLGGSFSDKMGLLRTAILGLTFSVIVHFCYCFSDKKPFLFFLVMSALNGFSGCLIQPSMKALMSLSAKENSAVIFKLRYIAICLGAILGPLIGYKIQLFNIRTVFLSVAILRSLFVVILLFLSRKNTLLNLVNLQKTNQKEKLDFSVLCDRKLLFYVFGGLFTFISFALFESLFPLTLQVPGINSEKIFPQLLVVNAISGIFFQVCFSLNKCKMEYLKIAIFGNIIFAMSFVVFALVNFNFFGLVLATILFSLGEALTIPSAEILIDEIAPQEKKASYFGLSEIRQLGFFLGPFLGGYILDKHQFHIFFVLSSIPFFFGAISYLLGGKECKDKLSCL